MSEAARKFDDVVLVRPYGPPTLPGTYSVSQCETFELCERKWGFRYIDRAQVPDNRFAVRGQAMHEIAEAYLKEGKPPDLTTRYGRLFSAGIPYLPLPGTCLVEAGFKFTSRGGVEYVMFVDMLEPEQTPIVLGDHKSTTSLKWALRDKESRAKDARPHLRDNPQAALYTVAVTALLEIPEVQARWVYYEDSEDLNHNKHPKAMPRQTRITREHAETIVDKLDETARRIHKARTTARCAHDLPFTPQACGAYGGCSYEAHCGLTDLDKMEAMMTQMSIRERLMKGKTAPANTNAQALAAVASTASQPSAVAQLPTGQAARGTSAPAPAGSALAVVQKTQAELAAREAAKAAIAQDQAQEKPVLAGPIQNGTSNALERLTGGKGLANPLASLPSPTAHAASAINPPEQPTTPIDDPADLPGAQAASGSAAAQLPTGPAAQGEANEKRARAPRTSAATPPPPPVVQMQGVTDAGYIFAKVYVTAFIHTNGDNELAAEVATEALSKFRVPF